MNQSLPSSFGNSLLSWLPIDAVIHEGQPVIEWMDVGDAEFTEPFFNETIARLNADHSRPTLLAEFDSLLQLEKVADCLDPTGFIFHSSRCGSTLLANVCRALNGSLVIAEAPVVDKIASRFFTDAPPGSPKEMLYLLFLRGAIAALGQRRRGDEQRYFVKFACTTTLQLGLIRRIWPAVPFIFLYRDPVEVIVSNLKSIPEWMQPESNPNTAAAIVGVDVSDLDLLTPEEFCARALGRFFAAAEANKSPQTHLLNYSELTFERIIEALSYFDVVPTLAEVDAIRKASRLYSKDRKSSKSFVSDTLAKRASASSLVIEMANKWARPAYERLNN
jgi:uncharacterized protein (DUF433 family)